MRPVFIPSGIVCNMRTGLIKGVTPTLATGRTNVCRYGLRVGLRGSDELVTQTYLSIVCPPEKDSKGRRSLSSIYRCVYR